MHGTNVTESLLVSSRVSWQKKKSPFLAALVGGRALCAPTNVHNRKAIFRGQKLNPNIFFSNFSGASGISRQNPGISRQKSLIPWVSRDIPNFFGPHPFTWKTPIPPENIRTQKFRFGFFFLCLNFERLGGLRIKHPDPNLSSNTIFLSFERS